MDRGFRTGSDLDQADPGCIGFFAGYKYGGLDIVKGGMLGEDHFPLGIKFRLHNSSLGQNFPVHLQADNMGWDYEKNIRNKENFSRG
jgi:hypothetical protein